MSSSGHRHNSLSVSPLKDSGPSLIALPSSRLLTAFDRPSDTSDISEVCNPQRLLQLSYEHGLVGLLSVTLLPQVNRLFVLVQYINHLAIYSNFCNPKSGAYYVLEERHRINSFFDIAYSRQ